LAANLYYVYMSYDRADSGLVHYLAQALRNAAVDVWLDTWNLVPGQAWEAAISQAIASSGTVLACLGSHEAGDFVRLEWKRAQQAGIPLVPVLLPGASRDVPSDLKAIRLVDLSGISFVGVDSLSQKPREPAPESSPGSASGFHANALRPLLERIYGVALERSVSPGMDPANALLWKERLARLYRDAGQLDTARTIQEEVLKAREALSKQSGETVMALAELAETEQRLGNLESAHKLFETSLERSRAAFGEAHPTTFAASINLVLFLLRHDEGAKARSLAAKVEETGDLLARTNPALRPLVTSALAQLAAEENKQGPRSEVAVKAASKRGSEDVERARNILRGQAAGVIEIWELVTKLKKQRQFGYSRRLLAVALGSPDSYNDPKLRLKLGQQHALCTYKDAELAPDVRFDRAFEILSHCEDLPTTVNQETLGIAGAIMKNKWEAFGQKADLERSLAYYFRGYQQGPAKDFGYTAINAAFVLDILADFETYEAQRAGARSESAESRRSSATRVRNEIVKAVLPLEQQAGNEWLMDQWWYAVTLAEAYFGLESYDQATSWLRRGIEKTHPADWELESTVRQLAAIARMQAARGVPDPTADTLERSKPWQVLIDALGEERVAGVRSAFIGKVGLALSGGGFRASLFHIGVLAQLAERDVLRHVEYLSCVSGGSIVGAHYYLEVRKLLRTKRDDEITRADYIAIVQRMEQDFLAGVQRNIRTRVVASFRSNLKVIVRPAYSRTERTGELYEEEIYSRVQDGEGGRPRWLDDLLIQPVGEEPGFNPKTENWRRRAKVPVLILNATSLNTGHNWQFTASWMGEPPAGIDSEIDANYRLRRMYYPEAPEKYRHYRLGYAVAASACVPGLFEPINLPDLYPGITVRLVDGGVHDNQGVGALLNHGANVLLVSDASGQMESQDHPVSQPWSTLARSNSILQARVREAEFGEADARRRSALLRGLMFLHLKKDLDARPVDWLNCEDPVDTAALPHSELTSYGIRKDIQRLLANIRTDLDSFHDSEAYALMTSGYRMAERELPLSMRSLQETQPVNLAWRFLEVEPPMKRVGGLDQANRILKRLLRVAACRSFKVWKLSPALAVTGSMIMIAAVAAALSACFRYQAVSILSVRAVGMSLAVLIALSILGKFTNRGSPASELVSRVVLGVLLGTLGYAGAWLHLWIFDPWYLHRGSLKQTAENAGEMQSSYSARMTQ